MKPPPEFHSRPAPASTDESRGSVRYGFTLIEMLVVIAIIALLASIVGSAIGRSLDRAKQISCASNLRQIGQSVLAYTMENQNGLLPLNRASSGKTWSQALIDGGYLDAGGVWRCPSHKPGSTVEPEMVRSYIINGWITGPWGSSVADQQLFEVAGAKYGPSVRGLLTEKWSGGGEGGQPRDNSHKEFQENLNYLLWLWNVEGPHPKYRANVFFLDGHVETLVNDFSAKGQRNYTAIYDRVHWRWL